MDGDLGYDNVRQHIFRFHDGGCIFIAGAQLQESGYLFTHFVLFK